MILEHVFQHPHLLQPWTYKKRYIKHYFPMIKGLNFSSLALVAGFVTMSATLSSVGTYSNFTVPACISDRTKW